MKTETPSDLARGNVDTLHHMTGDFGRHSITLWKSTGLKFGGGAAGSGTNSYWIDAWIEVPKAVQTVSSSALTSAGTWNNDPAAPGFVHQPEAHDKCCWWRCAR